MKKLALKIEDLSVDSLHLSAEGESGTVVGAAGTIVCTYDCTSRDGSQSCGPLCLTDSGV